MQWHINAAIFIFIIAIHQEKNLDFQIIVKGIIHRITSELKLTEESSTDTVIE